MFSFFGWLRAQARDAVLGGITDAAAQLDHEVTAADVEAFRARFAASTAARALAAKADDAEPEPPKAKRK